MPGCSGLSATPMAVRARTSICPTWCRTFRLAPRESDWLNRRHVQLHAFRRQHAAPCAFDRTDAAQPQRLPERSQPRHRHRRPFARHPRYWSHAHFATLGGGVERPGGGGTLPSESRAHRASGTRHPIDAVGNLGGNTDTQQPGVGVNANYANINNNATDSVGSGAAISIVPPFIAINFIIRSMR